MNINEKKANKDALGEWTATTELGFEFGLIRSQTLTPIFSKTIIDRAKQFSPTKTKFQGEQIVWFSSHSANYNLSKKDNKKYYGPENSKIVNSQFSCNFRWA